MISILLLRSHILNTGMHSLCLLYKVVCVLPFAHACEQQNMPYKTTKKTQHPFRNGFFASGKTSEEAFSSKIAINHWLQRVKTDRIRSDSWYTLIHELCSLETYIQPVIDESISAGQFLSTHVFLVIPHSTHAKLLCYK